MELCWVQRGRRRPNKSLDCASASQGFIPAGSAPAFPREFHEGSTQLFRKEGTEGLLPMAGPHSRVFIPEPSSRCLISPMKSKLYRQLSRQQHKPAPSFPKSSLRREILDAARHNDSHSSSHSPAPRLLPALLHPSQPLFPPSLHCSLTRGHVQGTSTSLSAHTMNTESRAWV